MTISAPTAVQRWMVMGMTNAERMIKLLKRNDAHELLDWWQEILEGGVPQPNYFEWWLQQEYNWGDWDG